MSSSGERSPASYLGALIGYTAWALSLAVVCLFAGRPEWLLELCLPALLISFGLALGTIALLRLVEIHFPGDRTFFQRCLRARLLCDIGLLLLLCTEWLLPILRADEELVRILGSSLGATIHFPGQIGMICLLIGCVLSISAIRRVMRESTT